MQMMTTRSPLCFYLHPCSSKVEHPRTSDLVLFSCDTRTVVGAIFSYPKRQLGEIDVTCARFSFHRRRRPRDDAKVFDDIDAGVDAISVLLTFRERAWNE